MMTRKVPVWSSLLLVFALLLGACVAPAPAAPSAGDSAGATADAPAAEEAAAATGPITVWTKFNDANPQNDQDKWLAKMLGEFTADTGVAATNVYQPYDQINSKLNLAVQAGGDVPDVSYVDSQLVGFYANNGTLMDLTDYVKSAPWAADLSPAALAACTAPDGRILCVPSNTSATMTYYWTAAYPDGFPADTEALLAAAPGFKDQGNYAMTFKSAEAFASGLIFFSLVHSFGGRYAADDGTVAWATPETVKAVEFLRTMFAEGYAPDVALAAGFDFETPFKDGSAGGFAAGSWSYVYLNPLTSFDGTSFDNGSASVETALKDGTLGIAPPLAAPGGQPASLVASSAWGIPVGSKDVETAKAFIDYQMTPARNVDFAVSYGGLPVLGEALKDPTFADSPYWQEVLKIQEAYGKPADPLLEYDKATTKFADVVVQLIQNPDADILTELQKAQDELNAGL
jgi:multiple sugar transport system substrate-binding protein